MKNLNIAKFAFVFLVAFVVVLNFEPKIYALEGTAKGSVGQPSASVLQVGLRNQIADLKAKILVSQSRLIALSNCHSQNMFYVRRNGSLQCWDPKVTFVP